MFSQSLKPEIDIWIDDDLLLKGIRPHPILMHLSEYDTNSELIFWNLLRKKLDTLVRVHKFNHLDEAGSIVVIPNPIESYISAKMYRRISEFRNKVLSSGRTLITATSLEYSPRKGEIVFLLSTYRSQKHEGIIATPSWMYDLSHKIQPISKTSKPTVGFIGATEYRGRLNTYLSPLPIPKSLLNKIICSPRANCILPLGMRQIFAKKIREKALKNLEGASELETSIIRRDCPHFSQSNEERQLARNEYIHNIQDNAYTLCVRGTENYSYRLYEVMSAGRIPIIIDTNMQLPDLGSFGRWEEFSVIVPIEKVHCIGSIVQEFHNNLSIEEFGQVCSKAQAAFEYLLPHNFILRALQHQLLSRWT